MTDKKENERRLDCPLEGFEDVAVILPEYWLGEHCMKRDEAVLASKEYNNVEIANLAISLYIAEGIENIPGIEGENPKEWKLGKVPLILINWLSEVVLADFALAYKVPKNS